MEITIKGKVKNVERLQGKNSHLAIVTVDVPKENGFMDTVPCFEKAEKAEGLKPGSEWNRKYDLRIKALYGEGVSFNKAGGSEPF